MPIGHGQLNAWLYAELGQTIGRFSQYHSACRPGLQRTKLVEVSVLGFCVKIQVDPAMRTPIVALFGPTLPERSLPWRDPAFRSIAVDAGPLPCRPCHQRQCAPGDFRCLTAISPTMVLDAARTLLRARQPT